jgi:hypothetical protein
VKQRCLWLLMLLACALVRLPLAAAEDNAQVPVRAVNVTFREVPSLSFSARDFVDAEVVKKLQSGLPQTLTTRMYLYHERDRDPLAVAALSCRVVYDLWEGVYRIERQTEQSDRTVSARSLDQVIAQCLNVQGQPIGTPQVLQKVRGGQVYFAIVTELNPLSQDAVQRIRRWLARPTGSGSELNGNAFFGSFVSIFVSRKLGAADKVLSFRSVTFGVPP